MGGGFAKKELWPKKDPNLPTGKKVTELKCEGKFDLSKG